MVCNAADQELQPIILPDYTIAKRKSSLVCHPTVSTYISSVCAREIPKIPINQLASDLGLGDVNEIL